MAKTTRRNHRITHADLLHAQGLLDHMRDRALKRGEYVDTTITAEYLAEVLRWHRYCPMCGKRMRRGKGTAWSRSPTIDRINILRGYIMGNIQVICLACNASKEHTDYAEHPKTNIYEMWVRALVDSYKQ